MRSLRIFILFMVFLSHSVLGNIFNERVKITPVVLIQLDVIDDIANAIRAGNSSRLASFFSNALDVSVPGNEGAYSKTQAELIFKDFFSKNPPKSFQVKQQGESGVGSKFAIGTYVSGNGTSFRTYYLVKKSGQNYLITLIEFDSN